MQLVGRPAAAAANAAPGAGAEAGSSAPPSAEAAPAAEVHSAPLLRQQCSTAVQPARSLRAAHTLTPSRAPAAAACPQSCQLLHTAHTLVCKQVSATEQQVAAGQLSGSGPAAAGATSAAAAPEAAPAAADAGQPPSQQAQLDALIMRLSRSAHAHTWCTDASAPALEQHPSSACICRGLLFPLSACSFWHSGA